MAAHAWRRRVVLGATPLALTMLAVGAWSLAYALQLASPDLSTQVFWAKVKYVGSAVAPTAWLSLALQCTGHGHWLSRRNLALLAIEPVVMLLLVWTNDLHGLAWSSSGLEADGSFLVWPDSLGAGFWLHTMYSFHLLLLGSALPIWSLLRLTSLRRRQAEAMLIGALAPWIGNVLYLSGLSPFPHLDLTPFGFTLAGLAMSWGLPRFRLLDVVTVAHELAIEGMVDSVIMLDEQNRILDLNPAAQRLLGRVASEAIGQPVERLWPDWPVQTEGVCGGTELHEEVKWVRKDKERTYNLRISPVVDRRGCLVSQVAVLRDITERKQVEDSLQRARVENARLSEKVQRALAERRQAEEALRQLGNELENRILQRTSELSRTNAELVRQIAEGKEVEAKLVQRNRELLSLQSAAAATASSLDLHFVLDTVTWEMTGLLDVEECAIFEWHRETDTLSVIAKYGPIGWPEDGPTDRVYDLVDYPLKKRVMVERYSKQMTVSQPNIEPSELAYMQESGIKTLLMLPLAFQDRVMGLVEVKDNRLERTFTDGEISLIQLLAIQAASAIENARVYERAQQEIAERKRAEEQIEASLKEKEVLLKEIHHRVKNNLQVISSLLYLQYKDIEDQSTREMFRDSQNRIRSMALIHEKLYRSQDLGRIDFAKYARNLATYLVGLYRPDSSSVALKVDAEGVFLRIDTAVPCGLIVNELVSNSLKHAFPVHPDTRVDRTHGRECEIHIGLRSDQDQQVILVVGDNGVGFPKDLDFQSTESLGLQLVNLLVHQLDGTIELNCNDGTEFKITFAAVRGNGAMDKARESGYLHPLNDS